MKKLFVSISIAVSMMSPVVVNAAPPKPCNAYCQAQRAGQRVGEFSRNFKGIPSGASKGLQKVYDAIGNAACNSNNKACRK